jgi:F-type H+-transporting ATPase subunit gamma
VATLRDIRRKIRAVKNTRQITKAMKMVAASKLKRAQTRMLELRPYADKMKSVILTLAGSSSSEAHPLFAVRPRKTVEVLVLTSDRGLCGAFNSNILKAADGFIRGKKADGFDLNISVIGKKASDYFIRRGVTPSRKWTGLSGKISYGSAQEVAKAFLDDFVDEKIDEVHMIYNEFQTVMSQKVSIARLLPLAPIGEAGEKEQQPASVDFIYEPSESAIFESLLPKNVEIQVFRALLESQASEEAARMTAMENATQNADEMIDGLTLVANKARQATITKELMDIVGGVEALK